MGTHLFFFGCVIVAVLITLRRYFILHLRSDFWLLLGGFLGLPPFFVAVVLLDTQLTLLMSAVILFPLLVGFCLTMYGAVLQTTVEKGYLRSLKLRYGSVRVPLGLIPRDAASQISSAVPRYVTDWKRVLLFSLLGLPGWYLASVLMTRFTEVPTALILCFYAVWFGCGIYALSLRPEEEKAGETHD